MSIPEGFVRPAPRNVSLVLAGALAAVGLLDAEDAQEAARTLRIEAAPRVCVVVVDGLGAENLAARSGHARTLQSWGAQEPITSVCPSTTSAAITALGTAALPGRTAMMGYSLRNPADGTLFSLIKWEGTGLDARSWQKVATLAERLGEGAGGFGVVQPRSYIGSGLSLAALRGAPAIAADTAEERVAAAAKALRSGMKAVYLYWGELDHAGHARGWQSNEWTACLEELDAGMRTLARSVPSGTLIILTADHGMVDVERRWDVADNPRLAEGVSLVAGEERAVQAYTDEPDAVGARWQDVLGEAAWVLTREEAFGEGLFGSETEAGRAVAGDVFAFMTDRFAVADSRVRPNPKAPFMVGVHGSLTSAEMRVPFLMEVA